jgi:hypothetical protein
MKGLGAVLVIAGAFCAQSHVTDDLFNGRAWRTMDAPRKVCYLTGLQEGMGSIVALGLGEQELRRLLVFGFSKGQIIQHIDKFYENPKHLAIPIVGAYRLYIRA